MRRRTVVNNRDSRCQHWRDVAFIALHKSGVQPLSIAVRCDIPEHTTVVRVLRSYGFPLVDFPPDVRDDPRYTMNTKTLNRKR